MTAALVGLIALGLAVLWLAFDNTRLSRQLCDERIAHATTKRYFRREVVREWASKMPKTGKIAVDPYCPNDSVYCINPNMLRMPEGPWANGAEEQS